MLWKALKLLILICLISVLEVGNINAFSDDEKKISHSEVAPPKKENERIIIETITEIVEDEECSECLISDPKSAFIDSPFIKFRRTIFKPFKLVGRLFKSIN